MVLTVTLNPCIDRTLYLDTLKVGGHNRASRMRNDVSGKGINVSVALRNLGIETRAAGFEFTRTGTPVKNLLDSMGIPFDYVTVDGELRVNTKVFDCSAMEMTEINCSGPLLGAEDEQALMECFEKALDGTDILVVDGSIPPGISKDVYANMVSLARARGIFTICDAAGELMSRALSARPDMVKPNIGELEDLLGRKINGLDQSAAACRELMGMGAGAVCLSLGGDGCMLVNSEGAWFSEGLDIEVKSFQGAGDSVVAGICSCIEKGLGGEEQLRYGVAAAHGTLLLEGTLMCTAESFMRLLPQIPVRRIG